MITKDACDQSFFELRHQECEEKVELEMEIGSIRFIPILGSGADYCTSLRPATVLVLLGQQLILLKDFQSPAELQQKRFAGIERLVADIEQALES